MSDAAQGLQQQTTPSTERETPFRAQRWQEQVGRICALGAAIALESIPVTAWLFVVAAVNKAPRAAPLPFWLIFASILAAWSIAAALRRLPQERRWTRHADTALKVLLIVGWTMTVAFSLLVSPAAYGGTPLPHLLGVVSGDLAAGSGRLGSDIGLALLVAYLWWRGLLLGRLPLMRERLYSRFLVGLAALILAIASAAALRGEARLISGAIFAILLPTEVFVGLVGIALAHLADTASEQRERQRRSVGDEVSQTPTNTRAWLAAALGISGSIVVGALVLALVVSYDSLRALTHLLGPLADALGTVISWLVEAFAYLLFLLLNGPITWAYNHLHSQPSKPPSTPPSSRPPGQGTPTSPLPHEWLVAGRFLLIVLVVALVALTIVLALRRFREWRRPQEFDEDRETLSATDVLGGQLRGLLALLHRPQLDVDEMEEPLAPGSVRSRYREVLRVASATSLARQASETPNEYAHRLQEGVRDQRPGGVPAQDAATVEAAIATLTGAYDVARYGGDATDHASIPDMDQAAALATAQQALLTWLKAQVSARDQPGAVDTHPPRIRWPASPGRRASWFHRRKRPTA